MKLLLTTIKSWNIINGKSFIEKDAENDWEMITDNKDFTLERVREINPKYILVPHWSWMIPREIWANYETVVFHPADLPFGRGGTPIQNQIIRGIYNVKLSALRVNGEIDGGPIYLKEDFDISYGNADNILSRASEIYFNIMIPRIINEKIVPQPQTGEVVKFSRRKPQESNLESIGNQASPRQVYDFIRMLDGEGYPRAYLPFNQGRIELYGASLNGSKLESRVEFKSE